MTVEVELREFLQQQINDLSTKLDERYATQVKAVDAAFASTQTAMQAALEAVAKENARGSAASEKRFEGLNELRGQLADILATLMPRAECEARLSAQSAQIAVLTSRLDQSMGRTSGLDKGWAYLVGFVGATAAIVALILSLKN